VDVLAEERQMACGIDEFNLTLAELAFMESSEHMQTVLTTTRGYQVNAFAKEGYVRVYTADSRVFSGALVGLAVFVHTGHMVCVNELQLAALRVDHPHIDRCIPAYVGGPIGIFSPTEFPTRLLLLWSITI
jgi:hypothetical protein